MTSHHHTNDLNPYENNVEDKQSLQEDPAQDRSTNSFLSVTSIKLTDQVKSLSNSSCHVTNLIKFYEDFCGYLKDEDDSLFGSPKTSPKSTESAFSPLTPVTPLSPRKHSFNNSLLKRKKKNLLTFVD